MFPRPSKEECENLLAERVCSLKTLVDNGIDPVNSILAAENVVDWCARECVRQHTGPYEVARMYRAWNFARAWMSANGPVTLEMIEIVGKLVDPRNVQYRTVNVRVGYNIKGPWQEVPRQMVDLAESIPRYSDDPIEWFRAFEEIHPFIDGNGRTGAILLNALAGTIISPVDAPDLWHDSVWLGAL